jgi:hypothetical protein
LKVLIAVPSAAIAALLSVAAIAGFLVATGSNFFEAMAGTVTAIAFWVAFFSAVGRLLPDLPD